MLNSKYISIKPIIERLYSDNGYEHDLPFGDILEWTADAVNLIGYPGTYIKKIKGHKDYSPFDITKFRAQLPCDFHILHQIAVDGFPVYPSNDSFHHLMDGDCCGIDALGTVNGDKFVDNFGNVFNTDLGTKYRNAPITYTLNNNWLTLSVEKGKVCMSYWAFPTDDEGLPLIPDDVSWKEFIRRYLAYKLDYIEWRKGILPDKVYEDSKQEYMWYAGQATNKAKGLDLSEMESLKNQILRLRPIVDEYNTYYKSKGFPEQRSIK